MSIKWLAVNKKSLTYVSYCAIDSPIWHNTTHIRKEALPNIIWLPTKKHKDQALLLLSLGLNRNEIETILGTHDEKD